MGVEVAELGSSSAVRWCGCRFYGRGRLLVVASRLFVGRWCVEAGMRSVRMGSGVCPWRVLSVVRVRREAYWRRVIVFEYSRGIRCPRLWRDLWCCGRYCGIDLR